MQKPLAPTHQDATGEAMYPALIYLPRQKWKSAKKKKIVGSLASVIAGLNCTYLFSFPSFYRYTFLTYPLSLNPLLLHHHHLLFPFLPSFLKIMWVFNDLTLDFFFPSSKWIKQNGDQGKEIWLRPKVWSWRSKWKEKGRKELESKANAFKSRARRI